MRVINQLPPGTPFLEPANLPYGKIINETDTDDGTPVVEEIYGDILSNLYEVLRRVGVVPNGDEDNDDAGYQLADAFQNLPSLLNVEYQLNLAGTVFSINQAISLLPNKYVFIAKAVNAYNPALIYTFKGSEAAPVYNFTSSTGFSSGDNVLLIIDAAGVRAIGLGGSVLPVTELLTVFGTPLSYNDDSKTWYQSEGVLFSDSPEAYDLRNAIRVALSDATIEVYEIIVTGGFAMCLAFVPDSQTYTFYKFALGAFTVPIAMTITGIVFATGIDRMPYFYFNGTNIFITNGTNNSANDYAIRSYSLNIAAGTLTNTGSINFDSLFDKTTNAVVTATHLYTFVNGTIVKYNLGTGARVVGPSFPTFLGVIFRKGTNIFYSNGDMAARWSLPIYT